MSDAQRLFYTKWDSRMRRAGDCHRLTQGPMVIRGECRELNAQVRQMSKMHRRHLNLNKSGDDMMTNKSRCV